MHTYNLSSEKSSDLGRRRRAQKDIFKRAMFIACLVLVTGGMFPVSAAADSVNVTITVRYFECNDGIDNDGDSAIDYPADPGCSSATDDDETDTASPQCSDSIDNDSDGLVDFPDDPGCESATDTDEMDPSSGGGGGGASGLSDNTGTALFVGTTSPHAAILLLKDGFFASTVFADAGGTFSMTLPEIESGGYLFSLYSIDQDGVRSGLLSFHLDIIAKTLTETSNIFIPPTVSINTNLPEDTIVINGYAPPNSAVELILNTNHSIQTIPIARSGAYRAEFAVETLPEGSHTVRARSIIGEKESPFGTSVAFVLGAFSGMSAETAIPGDFNGDGKVDLVDFSIAAHWFGREQVPIRFDLSGDTVFDLRDFSIMVYHWSG